jgi:hypothetical protein
MPAATEDRKPGCAASHTGASVTLMLADGMIETLKRISTSDVHAVEPICNASLPNAHGTQAALEVAPARLEAVLRGQATHKDWPVAAAKLPAAQRTHSAAAADAAEALPNEPAAHAAPAQEPSPGAADQVPERQAIQATAAGSEEDEPRGPALPGVQGVPAQTEEPVSVE